MRGKAAHESAADAENVDVHEPNAWFLGRSVMVARQQQVCPSGADSPARGLGMTLLRSLPYFARRPAALLFPRAYARSAAMPKEQKFKQQQMRARIAAVAARIIAEDGIEDYAAAKRKAARQLGAGRHPIPAK